MFQNSTNIEKKFDLQKRKLRDQGSKKYFFRGGGVAEGSGNFLEGGGTRAHI